MAQTILVVDDDASIRDAVSFYMRREGYDVLQAKDGQAAMEVIATENFDLAILDIMMEGYNGFELCSAIRDRNQTVPIILLSAKRDLIDKSLGFKLGADDYITKPYSIPILLARIKAVLRRCQPEKAAHQLRSGGLVVDLDAHTVTVDGARVALTYKEFELLRLFLSHPGMAFTRDQLFQEIWGMDYCGETRTVDMHIRTLRQKLGPYGRRIETVRNVGYRMEATT